MMETKRIFLGIDLPQELKEKIIELQGKLKKTGADVKWVEPDNFHFCLKFFGNITGPQMKKIISATEEVLKGQKRFAVKVEKLGAFPSNTNIRVVWTGSTKGSEELIALSNNLDEAFGKAGFEKEERPFMPHITLGRVRSNQGKDLLKAEVIHNVPIIIGEFEVKELALYESKLSPKGPKYEKIMIFEVRK